MLTAVSARPARRSSRSEGPRPRATLEESLVLALFDLVNHLHRRGEQLAAKAKLTTQQWLVLLQIAGDPNFPGARRSDEPVLASELARARGVSRATISAVISSLEKRGLIRGNTDPADGRRRYLVVTPAGRQAIQAIEGDRRRANARLLTDLDDNERKRMLRYVQSCLAVLWDQHEDERLDLAKRRLDKRT